jgi:hypothetical protein
MQRMPGLCGCFAAKRKTKKRNGENRDLNRKDNGPGEQGKTRPSWVDIENESKNRNKLEVRKKESGHWQMNNKIVINEEVK